MSTNGKHEEQSLEPLSPARRQFLGAAGGLGILVGSSGIIKVFAAGNIDLPGEAAITSGEEFSPNIWLNISTDDQITIQYPGTEMGQGTMTSLPLVLAEELDADWSKVNVETVANHDLAFANPHFKILYTDIEQGS